MNETGYSISFEQVSVSKSEGVNLRFIVNKAKEIWHLLAHPHPLVDVSTYQIDFPQYVTFLVALDSYTWRNKQDSHRGDAFRIYEKSSFAKFLGRGLEVLILCPKCVSMSYDEPIVTEIS